MAAGDRRKKILEHLSQSTNGMSYDFSKKKAKLSIPSTPPKPIEKPASPVMDSSASISSPASSIATTNISNSSFSSLNIKDRKRRIMNHVKSSSGDFGDFSLNPEQRKRQIIEHIRKSVQ
jgi:hypothetical protein